MSIHKPGDTKSHLRMRKRLVITIAAVTSVLVSTHFVVPAVWRGVTAYRNRNLIPRSVLFGYADFAEPKLSPDGKLLIYNAPDASGMVTWLKRLGQPVAHRLIAANTGAVTGITWMPDSRLLVFLEDVSDDERNHLFCYDTVTSKRRDLTPYPGVSASHLYEPIADETHCLIYLNLRDRSLFDAYSVDVRTGKLKMLAKNPGDVNRWLADWKGDVRAALAVRQDGGVAIRVSDTIRSAWRPLLNFDAENVDAGFVDFSGDGKSLIIRAAQGRDTRAVTEVNLKSGHMRMIASDPTYDAGSTMMDPVTHEIQAVRFDRDRPEWQFFSKQIKNEYDALNRSLSGLIHIDSYDRSNRMWIVSDESDVKSLSYYAFDRDKRSLTLLGREASGLSAFTLAKTQPIQLRARDGLLLHGYMTIPLGTESNNLPFVILVHGGPGTRDSWGFNNEVQWLANRGYGVLQVNYRGSRGFGRRFLNAGIREWSGKMRTDLLDARNWLVERGLADSRRIGIMGHSYGGFAVLAALAFTPKEFRCGVDVSGPSNLVTLLKSEPPHMRVFKPIMYKRVGNPNNDRASMEAQSPCNFAAKFEAPVLIAQGTNDPRVPIAEAEQMVKALRKAGKEVEYYLYPFVGHGITNPETAEMFYAAAERFLAKHLGGRAQPPSEGASDPDLYKKEFTP